MLNKKRQELIIQNLKSISSQVRLMSVEQLVNLPSMPASEKIKLLQACLNDSEEAVQNAAKAAVNKLSGNQSNSGSAPTQSPASPQIPSPSSGMSMGLPSLSTLENSSDSNSNNSLDSGKPQMGFGLPSLGDLNSNPPAPQNNIQTPLPNSSQNINRANIPFPQKVGTNNFGLPVNSAPNSSIAQASAPMQTQAPLPSKIPVSTPTSSSSPLQGQAQAFPSRPSVPSQAVQQNVSQPKGLLLIDGPVDPSLPQIQNTSNIGFLIQHISDIINNKPAGYLTRLFELAKSVHEEVALTALQNLYILKDGRVPPYILTLLNDSSYTSQRRFLMLKIIMETDVALNVDLLENILVNEKDVIIKSGLVKVYAKNCNQDGVPLLIRCLNDEDPRVRANTVEVIEAQKFRGCEREIIKLLNDSENRVKVNAAKYLVKIGYQQAFLTLRSMLVSPEVWLRDSVIFALGEIADQPSLVLLRAALKDPNQGIRLSVLKALARINNNPARQILKAATGDPDQVVSQVATTLFEKIKDTPLREEASPSNNQQNPVPPQNRPPMPGVNQQNPVPPQNRPPMPGVNQQSPVPPQNRPPMPNVNQQSPVPPQNRPPMPNVNQQSPVPPQNRPPMPGVNQQSPVPPQNRPPTPSSPLSGVAPQTNQNFPPNASAGVSSNTSGNTGLTNKFPNGNVLPPQSSGGVLPRPSVGQSRPIPSVRPSLNTGNPQVSAPVNLPPGSPNFEKPRSIAIYAKLCSASLEDQKIGMRDAVFVMGQDQMILLGKAITLEDESIRIAAVKVLARKRTPEAKEMLSKLSTDSNETVSSLAKKALLILK